LQAASTSNPKIDNTLLVIVTVLIAWPGLQSRLIDFAGVDVTASRARTGMRSNWLRFCKIKIAFKLHAQAAAA
jgi:hypothetical protein